MCSVPNPQGLFCLSACAVDSSRARHGLRPKKSIASSKALFDEVVLRGASFLALFSIWYFDRQTAQQSDGPLA